MVKFLPLYHKLKIPIQTDGDLCVTVHWAKPLIANASEIALHCRRQTVFIKAANGLCWLKLCDSLHVLCKTQLNIQNRLKGRIQYLPDQDDLICIQMPLPYLNFCQGTSCNIAVVKLQLCSSCLLRHLGRFSDLANIITDSFFDCLVHTYHPLHRN